MCCSTLIIITTYSSYYAVTSTTLHGGPAQININKLEQHLFYYGVLGGSSVSLCVKNARRSCKNAFYAFISFLFGTRTVVTNALQSNTV